MTKYKIDRMALAGLFIALGVILPTLFINPLIASKFLVMHIPVIICGAILGWKYGMLTGMITPLLRSVLFAAPPLFPMAVTMSIELGTYGGVMGILYYVLRSAKWHILHVYIILIVSMILGRIAYGIVQMIILGIMNQEYGMSIFLSAVVIKVIPGIILQLVLIPVLLKTLEKLDFVKNK